MLLIFEGELAARDTLRFAEEKAGFGLWQLKFESNELTCSPNSLRLLGLPSDNRRETDDRLTFASIESVAHPNDRSVLAELRHIMAQSLPFDREFRVVHRNGRVRTLAIHGEVLVDGDGRRSRAIGVLIDITHQTEAMLASHIIAQRLRTLMNKIGGSIWVAQSDGHIIDFVLNDIFDKRGPDPLLGKNWLSLVHAADREKLITSWEGAVARNGVFIQDYRSQLPNGKYQWRRCYAAPMPNDDGSVREWIGLSVDIENSKAASDDLSPLISGTQIRAGRGILNWSVRDLADRTGLTIGVVRRIEETDGISQKDYKAVALIKDSLSAGGVDFLVLADGRACVSTAPAKERA